MESLESVVATAQIVSELDPMRYAVGPDGRPYITRARTSASRAGRAKTSGGVTWSPWSRGGAAAWSSAGGAVKAMLGPDSLQHETMQLLTMGAGDWRRATMEYTPRHQTHKHCFPAMKDDVQSFEGCRALSTLAPSITISRVSWCVRTVPSTTIARTRLGSLSWRKGWDSNPRGSANPLAVFKTAALNHSATLPNEEDQ
jgi:hypothetical protein